MLKKLSLQCLVLIMVLFATNLVSCQKDNTNPPAVDPCAGKTIAVSGTATQSNCTNNGTITISATGSTGFNYKLNAGGAYQPSNVFTSLAPGTYTIYAKDASGCENSASVTVLSTTPISVTASSTPAVNCLNNGTITVTATGGTGFTYKLNGGGTYQVSNVFSALAPGNYTVYAKESGGCESSTPITVTANNSITVTASSTAATNCQINGTITITASGSSGFTYKLNAGGTYQVSNTFNNVAPGTYTAYAKDAGGCENTTSITVTTNNTIVVNTVTVPTTKCAANGTVTVNASGSSGFTYKLNAGGTYQVSNIFNGLAAGNYTMFAKDGSGCENSSVAVVATNNTAGPLFTNVKNLLAARCVSCHSGGSPAGGHDWTQDCEIVNFSGRINQRAVIDGTMPPSGPLSSSDKAIITNWINGGATFGN